MDEEKKNIIQLMLGFVRKGKRRSCQCICGPGSVFSDHVFYPVYTVSYNADPLYTVKL